MAISTDIGNGGCGVLQLVMGCPSAGWRLVRGLASSRRFIDIEDRLCVRCGMANLLDGWSGSRMTERSKQRATTISR
jgi:hypothetical protein